VKINLERQGAEVVRIISIFATMKTKFIALFTLAAINIFGQTCLIQISPSDTIICRGEQVVLNSAVGGNPICSLQQLPLQLQSGLVGYFPFCSNAIDESVNSNDGVVFGATLTTDRFGNSNSAYYFDGSSYIRVGNYNVNQFSLAAWVKHQSLDTTSYNAIIGKWADSNSNPQVVPSKYSFELSTRPNRKQGIAISTSGSNINALQSTNTIPIGQWYHVVATYNNQWLKLYINGILVDSSAYSGNTYSSTENIIIGATRNGTSGFASFFEIGSIDDVLIYNRPITSAEVSQLYNNQAYENYVWSNALTTPNITVAPDSTTEYIVTYNNGLSSCTDTVTVVVINDDIDISGATQASPNSTENYSATIYPNVNYSWVIENGSILTGQGTNTINVQWGVEDSTSRVGVIVCNDTIWLDVAVIKTAVNEIEYNPIGVYPNPVIDNLTVKLNGNAILSVYDMFGKVINCNITKEVGSYSIDLMHICNGIYTLEIRQLNNIYYQKLIKHSAN
jgi:hypothetical protein